MDDVAHLLLHRTGRETGRIDVLLIRFELPDWGFAMQLRSLLGTVAALAMTAVVGLGLASPALAVYGPESDNAVVSATNVSAGGSVTVGGDQFCPGSTVTVTVSQGGVVYITQRVRADDQGSVSLAVQPTKVGNNTVTLTGRQADCSGTRVLSVNVQVSAAAAGSNLPRTGGVNFTPLWAGLGLLVAGALLVTTARSRRRILV
jgi:LPXTG-motif cell wall-anchored protein